MSSSLLVIIFICFFIQSCFPANQLFEECGLPLKCGSGQQVFGNTSSYPFWGMDKPNYCGQSPFNLSCNGDKNVTLGIGDLTLRVVSVDLEDHTISVADDSLLDGGCPETWDFTGNDPFTLDITTVKIDLFTCSRTSGILSLSSVTCKRSRESSTTYHVFGSQSINRNCTKVGEVPVLRSVGDDLHSQTSNLTLEDALKSGFVLRYQLEDRTCQECAASGGICGSILGSENFVCFCPDKTRIASCWDDDGAALVRRGISKKVKIGIGMACGLVGVGLIVLLVFLLRLRKKKFSHHLRDHKLNEIPQITRYSYREVKKITKSFSHTIGKGGFGTVYGGNLCDGRKVAVKVLKDFTSNGGEFINELASMSQTSHVNIVSLLGFCYEGSKKAIVYEFQENGSLDQFISKKKSLDLDVTTLYGIALGVARGLEYLHHGCKIRIVHFDIKPQNVLLDDNLRPKVSDFGLAKLCKKRESIVSLLDTRGTIGYIAPEVFSRMYGAVSHKSDVYSYGMLVFEMIGARNKETLETAASNCSSSYFPDWIYKDLEHGEHTWRFVDEITREEKEIVKKMTLVGLWCIQPNPSNRPPMNRVVEMMEESLDALEVPPRPSLHFPAAPFAESSSWLSEENSN